MYEEIFLKIKKLLEGWGITADDWILTGTDAFLYSGVDIPIRKNHANIFVKASKLPWKEKMINIAETLPPKGTKYFDEINRFYKENNIDVDLLPIEDAMYERYKKGSFTKQIRGDEIYIVSRKDALHFLRLLLSHCNDKELAIEKGKRLLSVISSVRNVLKDPEDIAECESMLNEFSHLHEEQKGKPLHGEAIGKGAITGIITFIESNARGNILVKREFSTKDLQHMIDAAAIISEAGGKACHAAIVAREMNIPTLIKTDSASILLKEGMKVRIDFDKGVVEIIL